MRDEGCVAAVGAVGGVARGKPDFLRRESFGALYFRRGDATFHALPHSEALLLREARTRSAIDLFDEFRSLLGVDERAYAELLIRLRRDHFLDDSYRCPAHLRDNPCEGALSGPLITHVQLTRACNLRCTHCFVPIMATRDPNELTTQGFHDLFAQLDALGAPIVVLAGGEPMLRPDFFEIMDGVARHDIDARLCTNGTLITRQNARRLVESGTRCFSVSLDGPDAPSHEILRGTGRFAHTIRGIEHLVAAGADNVHIRVTVTPHNIDRLLDFAPLAKALGVHRVVIKPFRQSGEAGGADSLHIDLRDMLEAGKRVHDAWPGDAPPVEVYDGMPTRTPEWTRIIPKFGCVGGTTSATITYDGRVVGCGPVTSTEDWTLHTRTFADAWRDAPTMRMWRTLEGNDSCTACSNFSTCGGGCRIRSLGKGGTMNDPDPWAWCAEPTRRGLPIVT